MQGQNSPFETIEERVSVDRLPSVPKRPTVGGRVCRSSPSGLTLVEDGETEQVKVCCVETPLRKQSHRSTGPGETSHTTRQNGTLLGSRSGDENPSSINISTPSPKDKLGGIYSQRLG